ncbi:MULTISPECIES: hypothetical protein [Halorubrum]|jgi:hypothetical protein|uniref:Uncharacterized protein n=1 Tax=Halorubrum ezzemoulense TaxID=337243 RepID=A0A238V639_HALEZ|nr:MULTISPECIES: hypothetical protein [Halorubrum]MDB2241191.1 hypothetical protein [Halorubrum ezzemoulense]MDB2259581.1 hypothetical protein [Halorubrum ezzemoulense]MDB2266400.1 hypothetical protein [Halorubrum ezzemoulense]MDB9279285.1 hypothetical protein [Halorubrum ezzemoulense]MDB9282807.1 hypothetical protein [Halorubrum ezzemoulense]
MLQDPVDAVTDDERVFAAVMIVLSVLIFVLVFRSERSGSS